MQVFFKNAKICTYCKSIHEKYYANYTNKTAKKLLDGKNGRCYNAGNENDYETRKDRIFER